MAPLMWAFGVGCGGELVDGTYAGEPLLEVTGQVLVKDPIPADVNPAITLLWTNFAGGSQVETSLQVQTSFPSYFEMQVYQPPPDEVLGGATPDLILALGVFLLFDDHDGDGLYTVDSERAIGAGEGAHVDWFVNPSEADHPDEDPLTYYVNRGVPRCGTAPPPTGPPVAGVGEVDLVVRDPCELLPDWNCDGHLEEWANICE